MKTKIKVNDEFQVTTLKNEKGGMPCANINGFMAFFAETDEVIVPHQVWIVQVQEVKERFCIIKPLFKVMSAKENYNIGTKRMLEIAEQAKAEKEQRKADKKERSKKSYQYKSKNEISHI